MSEQAAIDPDFAPEMRSSFAGRVRNYHLPASARNTLMPVFEATTNALYAIQERFPETWADEGVITIEVIRQPTDDPEAAHDPVVGFKISDNGLGLTDELFSYFQELDTQYRAHKNGRGIGRLSWLKVFQNTHIQSNFQRAGFVISRKFDFRLTNKNPFENYREEESKGDFGTVVTLTAFREKFGEKAFLDPEDIKKEILAHFISIFAQPKRLKVQLVDQGKSANLSDFFFESIKKGGEKNEVQTSGGVVHIRHMLIERALAPIANSLVYCAADRAVVSRALSEFLGMKSIYDDEAGELIYIGLVEGDIFNDALNHERTGFDFGDVDFEEINKAVLASVTSFLSPYLEAKREKNEKLLDKVLQINPLYASAIGDAKAYVAAMPLNWDETKLVQDVAVRRYRAQRSLISQVQKLEANTASMSDEEFAENVNRIRDQLSESEKSALAQYVVERRLVIELLQTRRKFDLSKGEHQSEKLVHEVFCPLGVTSDVMDYDDHNLWLLDDRLAYYSYVASDRPVRTFARDSNEVGDDEQERRQELADIRAYSESGEPDLIIFQRPMLFRRTDTPDPVVIVEFKAPGKTKYSGSVSDNPVWQIRKYIESLIGKECYDSKGNRITDIKKGTPFHCYLVAEQSTQLDELLKAHQIFKPTPDGFGRFGYIEDLDAYFEFIPYDQVLINAKRRNEAFFKHLNIDGDLETTL